MTKFVSLPLAAAFVVATFWAPASATNIVTTPGFESPVGNGQTPTGWTADSGSANTFGTFDGAKLTGDQGLHPGGSANTGGYYQDLTTVNGQQYDVSVWFQNFGGGGGTSTLRVLVGSSGSDSVFIGKDDDTGGDPDVFSTSYSSTGLNDETFDTNTDGSWKEATFQFTASGTSTRFGVYNSVTAANLASTHSLNVDDVSVTAVPEATSILLMSIGSSFLAFVRRRRS